MFKLLMINLKLELGNSNLITTTLIHFSGQGCEWLVGCVALSYKTEFGVKVERETRIR